MPIFPGQHPFPVFSPIEISELKQAKSLALISGGPDSICLFHLLLKLRQTQGIEFEVLHFNHRLRGAESDAEETFVKNLCEKNGIVCRVESLDLGPSLGVQARARKLRLSACLRYQARFGYRFAFLAHHDDDLLETLLMKKARGAGLAGMKGIRRKSELPNPYRKGSRLCLFRPLLHTTKLDILNFLKESRIAYCQDSSNLSVKYFRNRVRARLSGMPQDRGRREAILCATRKLQLIDDYWLARLSRLFGAYRHFVPLADWDGWPQELQFRFFAQQMRRNGFVQQVEKKHFAVTQKRRARCRLGEALFFKDEGGCYFFGAAAWEELKTTVRTVWRPGSYYFGLFDAKLSLRRVAGGIQDLASRLEREPSSQRAEFFADGEWMTFPVFVGPAKKSDMFHPFGRERAVKVGAFLSAKKSPLYRRNMLPSLKAADGQIICLAGFDLSKKYRISPSTQKAFCIRFENRSAL